MDMISHAEDAIELLGDHSFDDMIADLGKRHGIVRCIEIIGEAGHKVSDPRKGSADSHSMALNVGNAQSVGA